MQKSLTQNVESKVLICGKNYFQIYEKIWIFILLFLVNTSCSQNFSLTEKTIAKYQNYNLKSFIQERFIERSGAEGSLSKVNIFLDKTLPKTQKNLPSAEDLENFRKKNSIYKAYYTSNIKYLSMPKKDLELLCKAQGGRFSLIQSISRNFVRAKYLAIIASSIKNKEILDRNQLAEFDYYSGSQSAVAGYQEGMENGYFGEFSCVSEKSNETLWRVGIYPIGFIPKKAMSQTDAHTLLLQIIQI